MARTIIFIIALVALLGNPTLLIDIGLADAWGSKIVRGGRRLSKAAVEDRGVSPEELNVIDQELTAQEVPKPPPTGIESEEEVVKEDNLMKKWDSQMSDFVPQQMYTMDIVGKTDEVGLSRFIATGFLPRGQRGPYRAERRLFHHGSGRHLY